MLKPPSWYQIGLNFSIRTFYVLIILISEYSILWVLDPVFFVTKYLVPTKSTIFYLSGGRYTVFVQYSFAGED